MIVPNDIGDELEKLVGGKFPGEEIYRELTPQGFSRPSTLIVLDGCEGEVAYGTQIIELRPTFTLTTYVEADEYHHSHLAALHLRQMTLVGLLLPGYVRVADRAPKVRELTLGGGYDYDTVTVTFSYTLSRKDFEEIEQQQVMLQLHLREEITTYG